jgi:methylated-DNA-protein-cysteine methyltransferase related protein
MSSYPTLSDPMPYYRIVWDIVRQVPRGVVTTFGQIASMIPPPPDIDAKDYQKLAPRWVGDAMNAVSRIDERTVPWHRVINSKGGISLPEDSVSAALQRARLREENLLDARELVDLDQYSWDGPSDDWLKEKGLLKPRSLKKPPADPPGQLKLF